MEQNQEEIKEVLFFFKKTNFSNDIFSRKLFLNDKRHKKEMIKKHFSAKAGETDFF